MCQILSMWLIFIFLKDKEGMSYEKMPISILERKREDFEESINSSWEGAMAATLIQRGNVGIRKRDEATLPLVIGVTKCEFGGPNSFKERRNCNNPSKHSVFIYSVINLFN